MNTEIINIFPPIVDIETVNFCNARCQFCPLFSGDDMMDRNIRPITTMASDLFENIVSQISSWAIKPNSIFLNMDGEPMLDIKFNERLNILKTYHLNHLIELQTNAEFLDEEKSNEILKCDISSICIGFDGATRETYERHRVNCHYDNVLENIKRFLSLRESLAANTRLAIKFVATPENINELEDTYKMFSGIMKTESDIMQVSMSLNWGSSKLEKNGFIFDKVENVVGEPISGCELFGTQLTILADGRIAPCCFDYNLTVFPGALANANETSLLEIWNGENRFNLRNKLSGILPADKPAKCQACTFSYNRKPIDLISFDINPLLKSVTPFGVLLRYENLEPQASNFNASQVYPLKYSLAQFEHIACPLCGMDNARLIFSRKDYLYSITEYEFPVVRCKHCGMVYVSTRPIEADIQDFYPEDFYSTTDSPEQTILEKSKSLLGKYEIVKDIKPGALLDIGCSKGEFLYLMKNKGWSVKGVEFSSKPPNLFNLDIFYGNLDDAHLEKESFDLITLWAVLEHVYNPKKMLNLINGLLKPNGKLVVLVTNFNSIPAHFMRQDDIPRHTTLFTKKTISKMLKQTNYEPENFVFSQDIFGGSVRGTLNTLVKLIAGEHIEDIIASNRTPGHWYEFSSKLKGKTSQFMMKVDAFDNKISPIVDGILDKLNLGFIMTVVCTKKATRDIYDLSLAIPLRSSFTTEIGFAWYITLPEYHTLADNVNNNHRSTLILLENGKPLWQRHSLHDEIRNVGKGRYSHWNNDLIFSTTDNSDPNTNGRTYQIVFGKSAE
jgi:MoaA/NifB/PqqE/SkfB family radical SAM enzyme/2-polyprenyl-3-methyl-5-hydroxy-6-metoxy-1,4-benzoquinol methylase